MPTFTVDSNIDVNKYLRAMGVNGAFDEGGFENIVLDEPLKVSAVKHRATVEVTRDGTVGAAASAIEIVSFSANLDLPKVININKPFMFFIRDTKLKAILFAGKYTNPDA
jgi:serpin B